MWIGAQRNVPDILQSVLKKDPNLARNVQVELVNTSRVFAITRLIDSNTMEKEYAIEISKGLIIEIASKLELLFSQYHFSPGLGTVQKGPNGVALSNDRADALINIYSIALYFAVTHEVGHIKFGHLEWCNRQLGISKIIESEGINAASNLTSKALELNADIYALAMVASKFCRNYSSANQAGIAMGVIYEVLAGKAASIEEFAERTHPHPLVRSAAGLLTLEQSGMNGLWTAKPQTGG